MKINLTTLIAGLIVVILGLANQDLASGVIQLPPAEGWLVPIISGVLLAITKHILDGQPPATIPPSTPTPPAS